MRYISTRGVSQPMTSAQAILQGLAPDGGLLVPEEIPAYFPQNLPMMGYEALAEEIFSLYLTDFAPEEIEDVVSGAYGPAAFPEGPAVCVDLAADGPTVLELWHGPTSAFKDVALQALPRLMAVARGKTGLEQELAILVATSGDTGKAALEGFKDVPGVRIIVFYPKGGVSGIQELQMVTTGGNNTAVVGVEGNFDDCQTGVKAVFSEAAAAEGNGPRFTSANSINWGRLLPQIVYYFYAYGAMVRSGRIRWGESIDICVPTGNFGNILAAYYSLRMGLPVGQLICASNENNVLTEALNEGYYNSRRPFFRTASPSMDILVSSNFERFLYHCAGNDPEYTARTFLQLKAQGRFSIPEPVRAGWEGMMQADWAEQNAAAQTIALVWQKYRYLLDPHTAVAYTVSGKVAASSPGRKRLLVSTASPFKFPSYVLDALDQELSGVQELELPMLLQRVTGIPLPPNLAELEKLPIRHERCCAVSEIGRTVRDILGK